MIVLTENMINNMITEKHDFLLENCSLEFISARLYTLMHFVSHLDRTSIR